MRYCLWKSIKNHHISTTDKLLFKFVLNKTMKYNYAKMLAFYIMMRYSYNIVLINRVERVALKIKLCEIAFFEALFAEY